MTKRWLTIKETGEYLSLHPCTVRRKIDRDEIPCSRIGRTMRIDLLKLNEQMENGK